MCIFYVCRCCDHGQVYCRPEHRDAGRRASRRRSNALHQASDEGRDDHRDRNRDYRLRRTEARRSADTAIGEPDCSAVSGGVTGHPARKLPFVEKLAPAESAPRRHDDDGAVLGGRR
jgi:hypothetical protein